MASHKLEYTKDGKAYYRISVSRGKGKSAYVTRWYIPEAEVARRKNPEKTIQKMLAAFEADFEAKCKAGEVMNREEKEAAETEALRILAEKKAEADRIAAAEAKIKTLRQYTEEVFLPAFELSGAKHTISGFRSQLNNHIFPALGDIKLPDLTASQISAFLTNLQLSKDKGGKGLKASSCERPYTILSLILKKAYHEEAIAKNIMDFVERPKGSKSEKGKKVEYFTRQEANYIRSCLKDEPLKWQAYIMLSLDTGARKGELCGLRWRNINFKSGSVTIEETVNYTPEEGVYLDTPKNGKSRTVPTLGVDTLQVLADYRSEQMRGLSIMSVDGFVFPSSREGARGPINIDNSQPMHPDSPTRYLTRFGKRYNIEKCNPHKFRHTFGTNFYNATHDLKGTSEIMGHSDTVITSRYYVHEDEERKLSSMGAYLQYMRAPEALTAEG